MKVQVYRNLHKDCWSVKHKGKVIMHVKELVLIDCAFRVQPAGRRKVIETQTKNVHAYVSGTISNQLKSKGLIPISYNPYKYDYFYYRKDESPIKECKGVKLAKDGKVYKIQ